MNKSCMSACVSASLVLFLFVLTYVNLLTSHTKSLKFEFDRLNEQFPGLLHDTAWLIREKSEKHGLALSSLLCALSLKLFWLGDRQHIIFYAHVPSYTDEEW